MNKIPQTFTNLLFTNFTFGRDSTYGIIRVESCTPTEYQTLKTKFKYNTLENEYQIKYALVLGNHNNCTIRNESQLDEIIEQERLHDENIDLNAFYILPKLNYWENISLDYLELSETVKLLTEFEELIYDSDFCLTTLEEEIDKIDMKDLKRIRTYPVEKILELI